MKREICLTKNGMPALWEFGGATTNTASCTMIGDRNGKRKKPVYIRTGGHLSNDNHALFILNEFDIVVTGTRTHEDYVINILRYKGYEKGPHGVLGEFTLINRFSEGSWDNENILFYTDIINATKEKMSIYHCRRPLYALGLNVVEDTIRDIETGKCPDLNADLSRDYSVLDAYFDNLSHDLVLNHLDMSEYTMSDLAYIRKYCGWSLLKNRVPVDLKELYEVYGHTNNTYHLIIPKGSLEDDVMDKLRYYNISFLETEGRDYTRFYDRGLVKYQNKIVVFINMLNVPQNQNVSYASGDAIFFTLDCPTGRKLCLHDHLSHIVDTGDITRVPVEEVRELEEW